MSNISIANTMLKQILDVVLSVRALAVVSAAMVGDWIGVLHAICSLFT